MRTLRGMMTVAGLSVLAACGGGKQESGAAASGGKTFTIALIAKSSTNPVFLSGKQGAEAAAAELSKSEGVTVKIDWLTPPNEDGTVQAQRIAQAVDGGANAILLSASDAGKVLGAVNAAVDRGVPVMTFDSDVADSKRFSFYGGDDAAMGRQVMDELATQMGGKGKIAIFGGTRRTSGFGCGSTAGGAGLAGTSPPRGMTLHPDKISIKIREGSLMIFNMEHLTG